MDKTKDKKKIMFDSPQAAKQMTVTGWVSSNGRFYGKDERMARWDGCTHKICECGNTMEKGYSICPVCILNKRNETFQNYTFKEWDYKTPLALYDSDVFFWGEDYITDYLNEHELNPEDLNLVLCRPEYLSGINVDQWEESLPENSDGELPKELDTKIKELNHFIESLPPVSWFPTKIRTEYKPNF